MDAALYGTFGIRKRFIVLALVLAGLPALPATTALAQGVSMSGQGLHDLNCRGCHDTSVYTRKERSVRSLDQLKQQLEACGHGSGKALSPAEKQQLVDYLNQQFYKFR